VGTGVAVGRTGSDDIGFLGFKNITPITPTIRIKRITNKICFIK
jgi:hypothetical protein